MGKDDLQPAVPEKDLRDPLLASGISDVLDETETGAFETLAEAKKTPGVRTLHDYLKELEVDKDRPEVLRKLHQLQLVLLDLGKHAKGKIDTRRVLLKPLPGDEIGEANIEGQYVIIDPIILGKVDLCTFRHALCHEMVVHVMEGIDEEGLTEVRTDQLLGEEAMDYEDLVANSLIVTDTIGGGDRVKGIERAISLYADSEYDKLFYEFKTAYLESHPDSKEDDPLHVFQLAFPLLRVTDEGDFEEDEEFLLGTAEDEDGENMDGGDVDDRNRRKAPVAQTFDSDELRKKRSGKKGRPGKPSGDSGNFVSV